MPSNVLVLEDEPLIALNVVSVLQDAGFAPVDLASTTKAALARLERGPVDVAVLDAMLGRESAAPVAMRLRERGIPFVVASGHSAKQIEWIGDAILVQKPFDESQLLAALKRVLGTARTD